MAHADAWNLERGHTSPSAAITWPGLSVDTSDLSTVALVVCASRFGTQSHDASRVCRYRQ
ncbi:hypothetical protein [Yimella sp. cx-51]|uniref:hypothetical protein n=1 Tax=Yimella sp. cx-51 TaxID=2770551 RepID=UPI00165E1910|nr:hypothetical protein [Yimella sp. cx-51]MBC9958410.1 hypothetical protein [Yimella sp. cx-51]QTH38186.1 hypothetical protein J5M86_00345 [Yimella sp. cx-51]